MWLKNYTKHLSAVAINCNYEIIIGFNNNNYYLGTIKNKIKFVSQKKKINKRIYFLLQRKYFSRKVIFLYCLLVLEEINTYFCDFFFLSLPENNDLNISTGFLVLEIFSLGTRSL